VSDESGGEKVVTVEQAEKEGKECDPVKATRGIIQTEFFDKHICGERMGLPY